MKLLHTQRIPGAYAVILIFALLLALLCLVCILYRRRHRTTSKRTGIPPVGIGSLNVYKTEVKVFLAVQLIIFVVIPVLSLVHIDLVTDKDHIKQLIQEASSVGQLQCVQGRAADKLLMYDGEKYPSDGCAITLSVLLQDAGIDVPDTFTAIELGKALSDRGWQIIPPGRQKAGDIDSTCGSTPQHGSDHIYLVLSQLDDDEMIIVDNQWPTPHLRFVSGQDKTPTTFFLRAS